MSIPAQISDIKYIESTSFEYRIKRSNSLLLKYPDKTPVILEKSIKDKYLPKMDKTKLLVANEMTVSNVLQLLKKNLKINEHTSIYIIVSNKNIMVSGSQTISSIYKDHKNDDGFLYLEYCTENVFG
jgi:microtubule-associated protein 1 light chain